MIFDYWKNWQTVPLSTIEYVHEYEYDENSYIGEGEGLLYCDGYNSTFWYLLNVEWYRMNNKQFANMRSKQNYSDPVDLLDEAYIMDNYL
jgi:hypothetical protein